MLLLLGFLMVSLMALRAEAALPADNSYQVAPPLRLDSIEFRAQEAALHLTRNGCLEVMVVVALPDTESDIQVYASCVEWLEVRPASQ